MIWSTSTCHPHSLFPWLLSYLYPPTFSAFRLAASEHVSTSKNLYSYLVSVGARGSVVSRGTMLQAGRSRVKFPMTSLDFSIDRYGLDGRGVGVRAPVGAIIFISPCRPDRPWSSPSLLSNAYRGLVPWG
jgi:hypothetical protein